MSDDKLLQRRLRTYQHREHVDVSSKLLVKAGTNVRTYEMKHHPKRPEEWSEFKQTFESLGIITDVIINAKPVETPKGMRYKVVDGWRRVEGMIESNSGKTTMIPCMAWVFKDEQEERILSLVVNMQRKELHLRDQADAVQILLEDGMNIKQISIFTGWNEKYIYGLRNFPSHPDEIRRDQLKAEVYEAAGKAYKMNPLGKLFDGRIKEENPDRVEEIIHEEKERLGDLSGRDIETVHEKVESGKDLSTAIDEAIEAKELKKKETKDKRKKRPPKKHELPKESSSKIPLEVEAGETELVEVPIATLGDFVDLPMKIERMGAWFPLKEVAGGHVQISPEAYKKMQTLQGEFGQNTRSEILNALILLADEKRLQ